MGGYLMSKFALRSCGSVLALARAVHALPATAQDTAPTQAAPVNDQIVVTGVARAVDDIRVELARP